MHLKNITSAEFAPYLEKIEVAILPIGSTEQHGPNLALSADTVIAEEIAVRLSQKLGEKAIVLPAIPYGISYHHLNFAGTVTLRPETLEAIILDIVECYGDKVKLFLLINGHGGNQAVIKNVLTKIWVNKHILAANVFWLAIARDLIEREVKSNIYGHACEAEVSVAMHLSPEIVREKKLVKSKFKQIPYAHVSPMAAKSGIEMPFFWEDFTENGVLGDATASSETLGARIVNTVVDRSLEFIISVLRGSKN